MKYDFSEYFEDNDLILNEFIDNYTTFINCKEDELSDIVLTYKSIIDSFLKPFEVDELLNLCIRISELEIIQDKPYAIVSNELYSLQNIMMEHIISVKPNADILSFLNLFKKIDNSVADMYLNSYTHKLLSINNIRINSLADLIDKNIIKYYEAHLLWLSNMAKHIQDNIKNDIPELDESLCGFGKWLDEDGKNIIKNNSKYKSIKHLHKNLHIYGQKIQKYTQNKEQHIVITYLEKCEMLSLSIGTELALIDNILMNKKVTKDKLTGAMNRNALEGVFANQYELSLATKNSFVIAMCDLDFFKSINDTYGHIAGDKVLKNFVDIAAKQLRNSDMIIRYGGEEFIIILPAVTKEVGFKVLEKIRQEFAASSTKTGKEEIKATLSMGLLEINPQTSYKDSFLENYLHVADKNLYCAKKEGRNKIITGSF